MILIFSSLTILLSLSYLAIIFYYLYWWNRFPSFKVSPYFSPKTNVSIIIAARNEEQNIQACLESIIQLNYPTELFEVILVNDRSTDQTIEVAQKVAFNNLKILNLSSDEKGKKAALTKGISKAKGTLIVTTDADCKVPSDWLNYIVACFEQGKIKFIAGPVVFENEKSGFEKFQSLDFMGMMLVTGAGISGGFMHSSNGANLAFPKNMFEELNGYEGNHHVASGDDILFMQKVVQKYPNQVAFLKNQKASVRTAAMSDLSSFLNQRIRWGTKSTQYKEWKITAILSVVFFFCWSIILSALLIPFLGWPLFILFVILLGTKALADYFFLKQASHFFGRKDLMNSFWYAQAYHILYIAIVGLLSNVKKRYEWKGRKVG